MNFQELSDSRRKTEAISRLLLDQLKGYLDTLRPLFAPERLFGRAPGSKANPPGADRMLSLLQEKYREVSGPPYDLPPHFDPQWLLTVGDQVQLQPWEYRHVARTGTEVKEVSLTSPVCWCLGYATDISAAQLSQAVRDKDPRRSEMARQFAVNALVMQLLVAKTPGLVRLFADLRYDVTSQESPGLPRLPLTAITSCVRSFRPPDDVILAATAFSGVPAFIELVDVSQLAELRDPFLVRIEPVAK